ncbi:MAG: Na+/H+ antiporter NhaC family protein [Bacteroidales bacterium]|nr:Na+/H+ antiporter NhaC family protein [Bacteroidales bacterium]
MNTKLKAFIALSPVLLLIIVYLSASLLAKDFYLVPVSVAFVIASLYALFLLRGRSVKERIDIFARGAAQSDVMYMIWIFCLAGVFAASAKAMGAIDATVSLTLALVPSQFIPLGIFVATCFISLSIGTSVGTIVALTPVVSAMAPELNLSLPWLLAIVVGGAFFGDNLSFISDTTIAATQTQHCKMSDKFRTNLAIVLPAALVTMLLYIIGNHATPVAAVSMQDIVWIRLLPYLLVIALALCGMNVLLVLLIGIFSTDLIAFFEGGFSPLDMFVSAGEGLKGMYELILVTLMAAGMMNIIKELGGFDYLIRLLSLRVKGKRAAEAVISLMTVLVNICTANNTIAILTTGSIAREMSLRYGLSPRKVASLMDTSSCFAQGILPYGAQLLMASALAGVSPLAIIPYLYYPMLIGLMLIFAIIFRFPKDKASA